MVRVIGPTTPRREGIPRRLNRDQAVAAVPNYVLPTGLNKCFSHRKPVFRLEKLQQYPLNLPVSEPSGDVDLLFRVRINAGVVHASRDVGGPPHEAVKVASLTSLLRSQRAV